jgi:hypothetical protein
VKIQKKRPAKFRARRWIETLTATRKNHHEPWRYPLSTPIIVLEIQEIVEEFVGA